MKGGTAKAKRPYRPRPKEVVSRTMSRIRGKDTGIERALAMAMWRQGLRYRKHYKAPGTPDFAFPGVKVAVFCDSAFWHGRDWPKLKEQIRANRNFWLPKIERNIARDAEVNRLLASEGWVVLRFWDDEIERDPEGCARKVLEAVEVRRPRQHSYKP
jgi:DNA mismatch endonuclease (patch repair protein)